MAALRNGQQLMDTHLPNPVAQNKLIVDLKDPEIKADWINIADRQGKIIVKKELNNQLFPLILDITTLPPGEYFIRIIASSGVPGRRFIKQ
jgi:hypothetical protein